MTSLFQHFDLHQDQASPAAIDNAIRAGTRARGTNLWVLMFAIFIASIGLNVNSTAVIIGAMLISPLMGPIIGIGYGAAVNDLALIWQALKNLGLFVAISLATAVLYFALSPLAEAQSELLARTTPTIWDVLIAFFGGATGAIAMTRRQAGNAVPGVAIATALMPPLCTAGYGIATGRLDYFLGAFYLFSINGVFIAFATLLFCKLLRLPHKQALDAAAQRRQGLLAGAIVVLTLAPSIYLAWGLVQEQRFSAAAGRSLAELERDPRVLVLRRDVLPAQRTLALAVEAEQPGEVEQRLRERMQAAGIADARVTVRRFNGEAAEPAPAPASGPQAALQAANRALEARLAQQVAAQRERDALRRELQAEFPEALHVGLAEGELAGAGTQDGARAAQPLTVVTLTLPAPLDARSERRLRDRLAARLPERRVQLLLESAPAAQAAARRLPVARP